jgi:hypothetical protein
MSRCEAAKALARERGPEFCEARARKGGQTALQKYGIGFFSAIVTHRWKQHRKKKKG